MDVVLVGGEGCVGVQGQVVLPHDLGDAEVRDLDELAARRAAVQEHQVRRLDVAVDDPPIVGRLEDVASLLQDAGHPVGRHRRARPQHEIDGLAFEVLHVEERHVVGEPGVVDRDGVRMIEPRHDPRLASESARNAAGLPQDPR